MWEKSYSTKIKGINAEKIWSVWTDINQWHIWQQDVEFAKLDGEFKTGNSFLFKPKGGPKMSIKLIEVEPQKKIFTDLTTFPLANMYGKHEIISISEGEIELKITISMEGLLSFLWRKLVVDGIVKNLEKQTKSLIEATQAKL